MVVDKLSQLLSQDKMVDLTTLKSLIIIAFSRILQDTQDKIGKKLL